MRREMEREEEEEVEEVEGTINDLIEEEEMEEQEQEEQEEEQMREDDAHESFLDFPTVDGRSLHSKRGESTKTRSRARSGPSTKRSFDVGMPSEVNTASRTFL